MGKAPAFQFYPNDWSRDLEEHPLEIEGAWIRICCKLWWAETKGKLSKTVLQWARILRVSEDKSEEIIEYLKNEKIADVTLGNKIVTIICRRMYREYKSRENTRLRVQRHRQKQTCNKSVTVPSSSPPSSSVQSNAFSVPSSDEINDSSKIKLKGDLDKICEELYHSNIFLQAHAFRNKMLKEKKNERAILHTLARCYMKKDFKDGSPWAYCTKIINVEDGNFSEREFGKSE